MSGKRQRGEEVRRFILDHVDYHARDIAAVTAQKFGISRQAVNRHVHRLVAEKLLLAEGATRDHRYALRVLAQWRKSYPLTPDLREDEIWRKDIRPLLHDLPEN